MTSRILLLLFFFIGLLACDKTNETKDSISPSVQQDPIITLENPLKLNVKTSKSFDEWKDYKVFNDFLSQFIKTTASEALSNAKELNTLALQLKDSIKIDQLKIPAFKARLNVLQNETMRLEDMVDISNLKKTAVEEQLKKIIAAFNATNAKLNNMIIQQELENDLKKLNDSI